MNTNKETKLYFHVIYNNLYAFYKKLVLKYSSTFKERRKMYF